MDYFVEIYAYFELGPEARGPVPGVVVVGRAGVAARVALRVQPQRASLFLLGCWVTKKRFWFFFAPCAKSERQSTDVTTHKQVMTIR